MADIGGTAANDILAGTIDADRISGGAGNDRINGNAGNDEILGGTGSDILTGDAGNDRIFGEDDNDGIYGGGGDDFIDGGVGDDILIGDGGNDTILGGAGNDKLYGGTFNDRLDGGAGNDIVNGEAGDDVLVYRVGEGSDTLSGGAGNDTVEIHFTSADLTDAFKADLSNYKAWAQGQLAVAGSAAALAAQTTGGTFTFASIGLTVSVIEAVSLVHDGQPVTIDSILTPPNSAPESAATADYSIGEDEELSGQVTASDANDDALSYVLTSGPANGSLTLDGSTGGFVYTPSANFNGSDTFSVRVSDPAGASTVQTVTVGVAAVNDAPVAAASAAYTTNEDAAVSGQVVASDIDGDVLGYAVEAGPGFGSLKLDAETGAFVYTPGANASGTDSFSVRVTDPSGASAVQQVTVGVVAQADQPVLTVSDASVMLAAPVIGTAGNDTLVGDSSAASATVGLDILAQLADTDGSEQLSVTIAGLAADALLSAGTRNADGTWTLGGGDLAGLTLTASTASNLSLSVTATATENTGASATSTATLNVTFDRAGHADVIDGGAGNDMISGGLGGDTLTGGAGNDTVNGGEGDDLIMAGAGNDTYDGGAGTDTIDFSGVGNSVTVDLSRSTASGAGTDIVRNVENVTGTNSSDKITGNSGANVIAGGLGNDDILGGAGNDTLIGGEGNDKLDGGTGNDVISDGNGNDTVNGGSGDDLIIAGDGDDKYTGGSGFDTLDYSAATRAINVDASKKQILGYNDDTIDGIEKIIGTMFNDTFKGGKDGNTFDGGAGNDTFRGMGGADVFTGGEGSDTFQWLAKDLVSGNNLLGADVITDFSTEDILDLRELTKAFKGADVDSIVRFTDVAQGAMMSVKIGTAFVDVALLEGLHGVTASGLLADGMILA